MDGIHDLGGMQGFGPVPVKSGDKPFSALEEWEQRTYALSKANLAPGITIDWFRHGIECMVPADYLGFPYFKKWCTEFLMLMIDDGTITLDEVRRGHVDTPGDPALALTLEEVLRINRNGHRSFETGALTEPAFAIDETVRTLRWMPGGHTRLPRYARNAVGTIIAHHGCHILADEGAKGHEVGDHLYTVSFTASELWGGEGNPKDIVTLDLWECYLVHP